MSPLAAVTLLASVLVAAAAPYQCSPSCGINAVCGANGACSCPASLPLGDAGFMCYSSLRAGCFAFGDPQLTSFTSEYSRIMFPCKITLAQFDTAVAGGATATGSVGENIERFSGADPAAGKCRFVVQSTTTQSPGGEYYSKSMDIKVVINQDGNAESVWIHLESANTYYYKNGGTPVVLGPRDCESVVIDTKPVAVCFVESKGMWQVAVPSCSDTEIVFRPWNPNMENQVEVVGFGILTKKEGADYSDPESKYPYSICHVPKPAGSDTWFKDFYNSLGLETRYGSFLYSFLLHPPFEPQTDVECQALTTIFNDCPTPRHVSAVNMCSPILIKYSQCAKGNGKNPLTAFNNCMKGFCSSTEKQLCTEAHDMVAGETCPDTPAFNCN